MILSMKSKDIIEDLKNLEDIFDFSNIDENHELFSNRNKKVIGKFNKYGCIRFIDSYRFLSESLGKLVKNLDEDDFKI